MLLVLLEDLNLDFLHAVLFLEILKLAVGLFELVQPGGSLHACVRLGGGGSMRF